MNNSYFLQKFDYDMIKFSFIILFFSITLILSLLCVFAKELNIWQVALIFLGLFLLGNAFIRRILLLRNIRKSNFSKIVIDENLYLIKLLTEQDDKINEVVICFNDIKSLKINKIGIKIFPSRIWSYETSLVKIGKLLIETNEIVYTVFISDIENFINVTRFQNVIEIESI